MCMFHLVLPLFPHYRTFDANLSKHFYHKWTPTLLESISSICIIVTPGNHPFSLLIYRPKSMKSVLLTVCWASCSDSARLSVCPGWVFSCLSVVSSIQLIRAEWPSLYFCRAEPRASRSVCLQLNRERLSEHLKQNNIVYCTYKRKFSIKYAHITDFKQDNGMLHVLSVYISQNN